MITERVFENPSVHLVLGNPDQVNFLNLSLEIRVCPGIVDIGAGACKQHRSCTDQDQNSYDSNHLCAAHSFRHLKDLILQKVLPGMLEQNVDSGNLFRYGVKLDQCIKGRGPFLGELTKPLIINFQDFFGSVKV